MKVSALYALALVAVIGFSATKMASAATDPVETVVETLDAGLGALAEGATVEQVFGPLLPDDYDYDFAAENEDCTPTGYEAALALNLTTYVALAEAAGIDYALKNLTSLIATVFAPNNEAFDAVFTSLGYSGTDEVLASFNETSRLNPAYTIIDLANYIFNYHTSPGEYLEAADLVADYQGSGTLRTVSGDIGGDPNAVLGVSVSDDGTVTINGAGSNATVINPNNAACATLFHIIDTVLIPPLG